MSSNAPGRPQGAKNKQLAQADGQLTRCSKCGSTNRAPYMNRDEQEHAGIDLVTGQPYTSIVRRRTACLDCGQHRIDRHLEYQPAKPRRKK